MFVQYVTRYFLCITFFVVLGMNITSAQRIDSTPPILTEDTSINIITDTITPINIEEDASLPESQLNDNLRPGLQRTTTDQFDEKKIKKDPDLDPESYHARKAAKWAMLPGGGQIYNKRWWKVPIAWGMIGAGGYFVYNSANKMKTYNRALDMRNNGEIDEFYNVLSEAQIISYRNTYRRNLQLSVFGTVGLWSLTILDAVVDAHLKTYDISDNLSIKFKPKVLRVYNNSVPSFAITLYL